MTTPFTVVVPTKVSDLNFVSSNIPENDHPEYSAITHYALGQRVIVTTGWHTIYESLENNNMGFFPPTNPTKWLEVGPTNRWAVFDDSGGTVSSGTTMIEWKFNTGRINSVSLLEVLAAQVRVIGTSLLDGVVYDRTVTLEDVTLVGDWYQYFYSAIRRKTEVNLLDIPPYSDMEITVQVIGPMGSLVQAGNVVVGNAVQLGMTRYGASSGIIDYSVKEVDEFGRSKLIPRNFAKRSNVQLFVSNALVDSIQRTLSDLRATPVLWIAAKDTFESLTVFGFYRDFDITIEYPAHSICNLEIEGLT